MSSIDCQSGTDDIDSFRLHTRSLHSGRLDCVWWEFSSHFTNNDATSVRQSFIFEKFCIEFTSILFRVYEHEVSLGMDEHFRLPHFELLHYYAAVNLIKTLRGKKGKEQQVALTSCVYLCSGERQW